VADFLKRIFQKISNISFKIISIQSVNLSKYKGYSIFPAVNSGLRLYTTVGREYTAVERSNQFVTAALVGKEVNYFHFYQQALTRLAFFNIFHVNFCFPIFH
jgi:hypothetical protein